MNILSPTNLTRATFLRKKKCLKKSLEAPKTHFKDDDTKGRGKIPKLEG
jgi:hypothetical protein